MALLAPLFRIRPGKFTTASMGLRIEPERADRIDAIIAAFFTGYNTMLSCQTLAEVCDVVERLPPYFRPFAAEGAGMGFGPRHLLQPGQHRLFEQTMAQVGPQYLSLYYVGFGWWLGRLQRGQYRQGGIDRRIAHFDRRYYLLAYDGLGFSLGLLAPRQLVTGRSRLAALQGNARRAALRGWGRSLWFVLGADLQAAGRILADLEPGEREDCYAGLGLAAAFTTIDRPGDFFAFMEQCGPQHQPDFVTGALFGWSTRRMCDPAYYETQLLSLPPERSAWIREQMDLMDHLEPRLERTPAYLPQLYGQLRQHLGSHRQGGK